MDFSFSSYMIVLFESSVLFSVYLLYPGILVSTISIPRSTTMKLPILIMINCAMINVQFKRIMI